LLFLAGENPSVVRFQTFPPPPPQSFQHINFFGPLSPPGQQVGSGPDNGSGNSRRPFSFPSESGKASAQQPGVNDFRFGNSGPFFFEHPPKHGQSCAGCIVPGDTQNSNAQRQPFPQRQPPAENGFQQQQPQQQSAFRPIEPLRDVQQQPNRQQQQQQQPQPQQFLPPFTSLREQQPIRQQPPFSPPPSATGFRPSSEESRGQQPSRPQQEFLASSGSLGPPKTNANAQQQPPPPPALPAPNPRIPAVQTPTNSREVIKQSAESNPSSQELLKVTKQPPPPAANAQPANEFRPSPQVPEQANRNRGSVESTEDRRVTDPPRTQATASAESLEIPSGRRVPAVPAGSSGSNLELADDDSDSSAVVTSPSQLRGKLRFTPIVVDSAETHLSTPFPSRSRATVPPLRPPVQPLQSTSTEVQSGSVEVDDDKTAAIIGSLFTSLAVPSSGDSKFGGRKPSIQGERTRLSTPAKDESVPTSTAAPSLSTVAPFKSVNVNRNPSVFRINSNARLKFNAQSESGLNKPTNNGNHPRGKLLRRPVRPQSVQDDGTTSTRSTVKITTTAAPLTTSTTESIDSVEDTSDTLPTSDSSQELIPSNQTQAPQSTADQPADEPVASSEPSAEIDSSTAVDDEVALLELLEASREQESAEVDDVSSLPSSAETQSDDDQKPENQELDSQPQSADNKGPEQSTTSTTTAVFDKDPIELLNSSESADSDADARLKETAGPKAKLEFFNLDSNSSKSVVDLSKVVFVPNLDLFRPTPRNTDGTTSVQTSGTAEHNAVTEGGPAGSPTGDRQSKAIVSNDSLSEQLLTKQKAKDNDTVVDPLEDKVPTEAIESSIDQLDFLQSELSSKHLANSFHLNEQSGSPSTDGSQLTTQPTTPPAAFERPRRPFDFLNKVRTVNSSLSSSTSVNSPASQVVTPAEITTVAPSAAVTSPTGQVTTTKAISLFDQLLTKIVFKDSLDSLLPPGFVMPAENEDQPANGSSTTSAVPDKPPQIQQVQDISALLPPGFESSASSSDVNTTETTPSSSSTSSSNKGGIESLLEAAVFDDISSLLPPGFKQHLYTPSPAKSTTESPESSSTSSPDESATTKKWLVFPTRPAPARTPTSEKPKARGPPPPAITIKSGWPVR
jgi:hypothetical protein